MAVCAVATAAASAAASAATPLLLNFRHLEKTGGTTIREWLLRNAGKRPNVPRREQRPLSQRLDGFVRYYEARCFWCVQFPELHTDAAKRACADLQADCAGRKKRVYGHEWRVAGSWRRSRYAVEWHGGAAAAFFEEHVFGQADALQRLYAAHNGTAASLVVLREPRAHLLSAYKMWPPRGSGAERITFADWLASAGGAQTGMLGSRACVGVTRERGMRNACGCGAAQQAEAETRLARYDIVGVTRCLAPDLLRELEVRLRWAPDTPADARVRAMGPDGRPLHMKLEKLYEAAWSERKTVAAQQQPAGWAALNSSDQARVAAAAACDEPLYRAALRRAPEDCRTSAR